jgi:tRNA 2-thiouridine synthesizing protein A
LAEPVLIDVRGLKCPLPVLKTAQRMLPRPAGTRFLVLATDTLAALDVPNFCREEGHRLIRSAKEGKVLSFEIEKGGKGARRQLVSPGDGGVRKR